MLVRNLSYHYQSCWHSNLDSPQSLCKTRNLACNTCQWFLQTSAKPLESVTTVAICCSQSCSKLKTRLFDIPSIKEKEKRANSRSTYTKASRIACLDFFFLYYPFKMHPVSLLVLSLTVTMTLHYLFWRALKMINADRTFDDFFLSSTILPVCTRFFIT